MAGASIEATLELWAASHMNLHLAEIARSVAPGAHAVLIMD
jgi:hypothetical protein